MTFKLYREASEAAGTALTSRQALTAAFKLYLGVRYTNWGTKSAETSVDLAFTAALKKAEWEFDAFASEPGKQPGTYTGALNALEAKLVKDHALESLFANGTQVWNYRAANPTLGAKLWEHLFHGEKSGSGGNQTHVGLHSMVKIIAGNHNSGKARDAITVVAGEEDADTRVYKAAVTIYAKPKSSTFFPDAWTEPQIKRYVEAAVRYWLAAGPDATAKRNESPTIVKWAGLALVDLPSGMQHRLWIGGLGDAGSATGIVTAFPQFRGSFDP
jgi:hypothetical protein